MSNSLSIGRGRCDDAVIKNYKEKTVEDWEDRGLISEETKNLVKIGSRPQNCPAQ